MSNYLDYRYIYDYDGPGHKRTQLRYHKDSEPGHRTYERKKSVYISIDYTSVDELIEVLQRRSEGMTDTSISSYVESLGDSEFSVTELEGWVEETDQSVIDNVLLHESNREELQESRERADAQESLNKILRKYPDLRSTLEE